MESVDIAWIDSTLRKDGAVTEAAVLLVDVADGSVRATLTPSGGRSLRRGSVAVGPDGSWLAVAYGSEASTEIWDLGTGTGRKLARRSGLGRGAALEPAGPDPTGRAARNPGTGKLLTTLPHGNYGSGDYVAGACVSPDGVWLATLDRTGVVRVW